MTTTKRFFLQLLQAHLHSIPQCRTSIQSIIRTISSTWQTALLVTEAIRFLSQTCITDESILSDERLAVDTVLLLSTLQTKVHIRFEIAATASEEVNSTIKVEANVVYGEKYDGTKMGEFITTFTDGRVGSMEEVRRWADGVEQLKERLIKRGKKGERVM